MCAVRVPLSFRQRMESAGKYLVGVASHVAFKGAGNGRQGLYTRRRVGKARYLQRSRIRKNVYLVTVRWSKKTLSSSSKDYDPSWGIEKCAIMQVESTGSKRVGRITTLLSSGYNHAYVVKILKALSSAVVRTGG